MPVSSACRWYSYNNTGSPIQARNYIYTGTLNLTCSIGKKICAICAIYTTSGPSIGLDLQSYINNALAIGTSQPPGATTKKYVYVRPV